MKESICSGQQYCSSLGIIYTWLLFSVSFSSLISLIMVFQNLKLLLSNWKLNEWMNYKSKMRQGHSCLIARKKQIIASVRWRTKKKWLKKLILHFIRKPDEERKYCTNVDTMTAIQVKALSHYATVTKRVKLMTGCIAR